ncbi:hypothetical protein OnM2_103031, partial [Erysiphe neolycopersici]
SVQKFGRAVEEKWKPKEVEQEVSKRPVTPPIVAMATVGKLSAFIATNSDEYSHIKKVDGKLNVNDEFKTTFKISETSSSNTCELNKSWILDSRVTIHVCNERNRFTEFEENLSNECLWAGNTIITILGYGAVELTVKSPKYPDERVLKLINVVFVPTLHTNVVLRLLIAANIHWDTKNSILTFQGRHFADTSMMFNQWVL